MAEHSSSYSEILRRLEEVYKKQNLVSLLYGLFAALLVAIVLFLIAVVSEQLMTFNTTGRTILFGMVALGVVASSSFFVVRPVLSLLRKQTGDERTIMAQTIGKHFPGIRDRLLDAIQLYEHRNSLAQNYSPDLIDASFADLYRDIRPLNFLGAIDDTRTRRMRKYTLYAAALFVLVFVVSPSGFFDSVYRITHYGQSFATTQPIRFIVEPGNVEVVRGENVPMNIRVEGQPAENVTLHQRPEGQIEFENIVLQGNDAREYRTEITGIRSTTEYYVSASDASSDKFRIKVLDRPLIRSLVLRVTPPAYTRLPASELPENTGDVSAYPGTTIRFNIVSSKSISSAEIMFSDSTSLQLNVKDAEATATYTIRQPKKYHIQLKDVDGLPNTAPIEYSITPLVDAYPVVEIISPGKNVNLTEDTRLSLFSRIKDDFGFSRMRLAYRLVQSRYEQPAEEFSFVDVPLLQKNIAALDVSYLWDLTPLRLVPEDAVAYYLEIFDNDNISGPKSGRSETFIVRLPSLEEVLSDVDQTHQQSMESMQSVSQETQQLKKEVEELQREMKKGREKMDWQQQKKAEEMSQRYESIRKKIEETSSQMDEMMKKMEDNKILSEKTLDKYKELQKLMEKLNSPELQEALKKLQESMKQLSPEQMKQALEQVKSTEEQFRQSLERTIDLLKRIHIEQKLDELIKRAEALKQQQQSLQKQTAETKPSDQQKRDELAKQQEDMKKQAESLEKETSDLKEKMEEFSKEMPMEEMGKAQEQLKKSQLQKKMQQSSQQMQSGDMQSAKESQEQTEKELSDFQQQMQQVQNAMQEKQMKQVVNALRKQLQNAVELSKRQESLKDETKSLDPNSQRFRENAQEQNEMMNDLNNMAQALAELSKKTFAVGPEMGKEVGNALNEMSKAMEGMEGRNPGQASQSQNAAMGALNRAAMMMQSTLAGMMQGGQGGMGMAGLMARLGQMAGQQSGINTGTQEAMGGAGQGQGEMLSAQQQAEYQRLSGQQSAVQKSLEQLAEEAKNTGEFSKLLGDLDRVAKEMQEVTTDLAQGNVNPETIQKQERILSRLLDSQRSMRERDFEKRRTANAGKTMRLTSPTELDLTTQEGKNRLREEMLKVLEGKYSKDYEDLIKKYFEQLEKEKVDQ